MRCEPVSAPRTKACGSCGRIGTGSRSAGRADMATSSTSPWRYCVPGDVILSSRMDRMRLPSLTASSLLQRTAAQPQSEQPRLDDEAITFAQLRRLECRGRDMQGDRNL